MLYVLHASTSLADLDPQEVVEMLKRRPLLAVTATSSSPTKVYGHLVPASPTKIVSTSPLKAAVTAAGSSRVLARSSSLTALTSAISTEQERDLAVFYSFCAVKEFMSVLGLGLDPHAVPADTLALLLKYQIDIQRCSQMKPAELEAAMSQRLARAKEFLTLVYPLNYRLEVLEDIFSLLFVRGVDLSLPGAEDSSSSATDESGHHHKEKKASGSSTAALDGGTGQATHVGGMQFFAVTNTVAKQLLSVLKDCLISLTSAKFAQLSTSSSVGDALDHGDDLVHTSVPMDSLQTRITRLDQWINEAKWRLALIVGGPVSTTSRYVLSSSSDESSMSEVEISSSDTDDDAGEARRRQQRKRRRRPRSRASPSSGSRETTPKEEVMRRQPSRAMQSQSGPTDDQETPTKPRQTKVRLRLRSSGVGLKSGANHHDAGVVSQMLATPESLLRTCLRHHRFERAREVIKMFNLEGKECAQEVLFAERLLTGRERLVSLGRSGPAARKVSLQSIASSIHSTTQRSPLSGGHGRQANTVVNELLSSSAMPSTVGELKHTRSSNTTEARQRWQQHLNSLLPSLVVMDLVTTCNMDRSISNQLLSLALERAQTAEPVDHRPKSTHASPVSASSRSRSRASGALRESTLVSPDALLRRWQQLLSGDSYVSLPSLLPNAVSSQVRGVDAVRKLIKLITSRSLHHSLAAGMEPLAHQAQLAQLLVRCILIASYVYIEIRWCSVDLEYLPSKVCYLLLYSDFRFCSNSSIFRVSGESQKLRLTSKPAGVCMCACMPACLLVRTRACIHVHRAVLPY